MIVENVETITISVSDKASPNMEDSTFRAQPQSTESFPSSNNMMCHPHRSLVSTKDGGGGDDDDDGGGPTQNDRGANQVERCSSSPTRPRTSSSNIFRDDVVAAVPLFITTSGESGAHSDSAVVVRTLQPFDISPNLTAFKSPGGGMEAASLGFPFTAAQWKELERQAMIYKYMMASVPVPPDLLFPTAARNLSADPTAPLSNLGTVYKLRCGNRDLEPGRCKRTDGKKWRCSRDVAPHQKYCERHMHRGRPRSRKPVEVHPSVDTSNNNKKTRLHHQSPLQNNPTPVPISNPGSQAHISPLFIGTTTTTAQPKDPLVLAGACKSYKQPHNRVPDWMMDGEMGGTNGAEQQWLHLMDINRGLASKEYSIYGTNTSVLQEEPLNLFCYPDFVPEDIQINRTENCNMFLNSDLISSNQPQMEDQYPMSKGFFDAWSNGNPKTINNESSVSSSQGNISPSLNLSIAMAADEGMGFSDVCHSVADSNQRGEPKDCQVSWLHFPSGGPLAEVLQPSSITGGSNPASPYTVNGDSISPSATAVSSPSGVLHRALFTHSDGSVCNSPTIAPSSAPPEVVAFQWLS